METRQGQLNIGLTYYQECQWLVAIKRHGTDIMSKSLLSLSQKAILAQEAKGR